MKIAFLVDRYPPRPHTGIGTFVQTIARGLHGKGHKVTVVDVGDKPSQTLDQGIPVITLRGSRLPYIGNLVTRLRVRNWLRSRFKAGEIDVIELADYPGYLSFPVRDCTTVVRLHQSDSIWSVLSGTKATKGVWFYEKRNLAANSNWIGVSSHIVNLTQQIFRVSPKKSVVIHNPAPPLPMEETESPDLPEHFVLFASDVARRKGALILAEAARQFLDTRPDLHLVYAGGIRQENGCLLSDNIRDIVGPRFSERVHFLGLLKREAVVACMKRAQVFAFPALWDCFPMAVLEAMSCGVPIVFTKNPPGPEMIEDGVSGLLADPDSAADVAQKIGRLVDDRDLAQRLAFNARNQVIERFSLEQCIKETEIFYAECMEN